MLKKLFLAILFALPLALPAIAHAADEVVISERRFPGFTAGGDPAPILGVRITTQVLDVATASAAFNANTNMIRICNNATAAIWYVIADSSPSATANTNGNEYLPSGQCVDEPVAAGQSLDSAADS